MKVLVRGVAFAGPPAAFLLLVLIVWDRLVVGLHVGRYLLPRPIEVWEAAVEHAAALMRATVLTGGAALCGLGLSIALGSLAAFAFSQSRLLRRSMYPYAIFLQTVPIVGIAPVVISWFGTGFASIVVVSAVIGLFPVITNVTTGLLVVDRTLAELFAVHNATRGQTLLKLRLPGAVPYLVAGAKTSCGLAVIGAIVGEMFAGYGAAAPGLGALIAQTHGRLETPYLFAAILASTLLGVLFFGTASLAAGTILARWHVES
jgi:NitT/TauT family transport system permease protein